MLALQHTLVCALQQLTLRARTPDAATAHAQSALALGAVAAWRLPGHDECRTHVLLDSDEQSPEFCARVTPIVVDASNAEPLYAPDDWDTSVPPAFRPMLISRALWIAALPCDETLVPTPPPMAVQLRLLDSLDSNVFLTTARASLHASTLMMLSLLVEHRAELRDGAFLDYGCGSGTRHVLIEPTMATRRRRR
jgi:ribosomal protein L11 methylase PrmA